MKLLGVLVLLILHLQAYSQDEIITRENKTREVRIVSEEKKWVNFYFLDDLNKTIQRVETKNIKKIKYESPPIVTNTIQIIDDSLEDKDLFSNVVSYLIETGYELNTFDMEHMTASVLTSSNFRISAEIEDHKAVFSGYSTQKKVSSTPSQSERNVIRLEPREKKEEGKEKYPGEERIDAGNGRFKEMDAICRKYLMNNKGSLKYVKD